LEARIGHAARAAEEIVSTATAAPYDERLAEQLVLDELFDLSLYRALRERTGGDARETLDELIPIEARHYSFWQEFFDLRRGRLDLARRVKLRVLLLVARLFGPLGIHLILEAIEVYGIRKYLAVWDAYKDGALGQAVQRVLEDEFRHEDEVVTHLTERKINPQRIRDVFLGLNDGLVEILGAVSGFFAAFGHPLTVLLAALTTAVAGALSMAAGAFVATSSEQEVARTETRRRAFLKDASAEPVTGDGALRSAIVVGVSYLAGAMVPVVPLLLGATSVLVPMLVGGAMTLAVSFLLAVLSGMEVGKRVSMNLAIIAGAVGVTYLSGLVLKTAVGVSG
jgi:VIT1/CCC1 family predicted Fe2+/Mn2+ transporter